MSEGFWIFVSLLFTYAAGMWSGRHDWSGERRAPTTAAPRSDREVREELERLQKQNKALRYDLDARETALTAWRDESDKLHAEIKRLKTPSPDKRFGETFEEARRRLLVLPPLRDADLEFVEEEEFDE